MCDTFSCVNTTSKTQSPTFAFASSSSFCFRRFSSSSASCLFCNKYGNVSLKDAMKCFLAAYSTCSYSLLLLLHSAHFDLFLPFFCENFFVAVVNNAYLRFLHASYSETYSLDHIFSYRYYFPLNPIYAYLLLLFLFSPGCFTLLVFFSLFLQLRVLFELGNTWVTRVGVICKAIPP